MAAWRRDGGLEQLLDVSGAQLYIEARAPGAGFADTCLLREAGAAVAQSVLLSPSALHAGLLANLHAPRRLVEDWGWEPRGALRDPATPQAPIDRPLRGACRGTLAPPGPGAE